MISHALGAELFKLRRNRAVLFWAFLFAPAASLVIGLGTEMLARLSPLGGEFSRVDPLAYALRGLAASGNLFVVLLLILGGAVMFAGEYRWETWRAIVPRAGRTNILIAKALAFAAASALCVLFCAAAGVLVAGFGAAANGGRFAWPDVGAAAASGALLIGLISAFLQVWFVGALCAAAAVATRSILATFLIVFIALVAQEFAIIRIQLSDAPSLFAAIPALANRGGEAWAAAALGDPDAVGAQLGPAGLVFRCLWIVLLIGAALAAFVRQDLARE